MRKASGKQVGNNFSTRRNRRPNPAMPSRWRRPPSRPHVLDRVQAQQLATILWALSKLRPHHRSTCGARCGIYLPASSRDNRGSRVESRLGDPSLWGDPTFESNSLNICVKGKPVFEEVVEQERNGAGEGFPAYNPQTVSFLRLFFKTSNRIYKNT